MSNEEPMDVLKRMFLGDDAKYIAEIKQNYVSGFSSSLALTNTAFVMYLYYKILFKGNKEATLQVFDSILNASHKTLCEAMLASVVEGDKDMGSFLKDISDDLLKLSKATFDETFNTIKDGIIESFNGSVIMFDKLEGRTENK